MILENDDHHSFEFVVGVLVKALRVQVEKAVRFAKEAHESGRAIIWTGPKEGAELKVEQIQTFHEPRGDKSLGPVGVTIEPAA